MKRSIHGTVVAAVLTAAGISGALTPSPASAACPVQAWEHAGFHGQMWCFGNGAVGDLGAANDRITSVRNNGGRQACFYTSKNWSNSDILAVPVGLSSSDVSVYGPYSDNFESFQWC